MGKLKLGAMLLAAGLVLAAPVLAQHHDRDHQGNRRDYPRRDDGPRPYYPPPARVIAPPPPSRACGDFAPCGYARPSYPPPYQGGARNWRRGEFLPPPYWAGAAIDPRRYRLRTPPPGYGWYAVGRDAYLVQRSTGLIVDTAPGAW